MDKGPLSPNKAPPAAAGASPTTREHGVNVKNRTPPTVLLTDCFPTVKVSCLEEALQRSQGGEGDGQLRVSVLLDYTRGSRGVRRAPSSPVGLGLGLVTPIPSVCSRAHQLQDYAASVAAAL